ncbi:MAG: AIR synthase family protein [Cyclobacteriaceae bacterium]
MSAFDDNSGKIADQTFKEILLPQCGAQREEVLIGPSFGVDTSVIDIGNGMAMAVTSDPLSLISTIGMEASARLSVHLMANDMATTGIAPQYAQFVLNLPPSLSRKAFEEYWGHIHRFCEELGVAITGGHTGQIAGQNSTISGGGTMFLTAPKKDIITSNHACPGDVIVVTKEAAITSTALLAMCFPETVKNKAGNEVQQTASANFQRMSSLNEALFATKALQPNTELTAMHDVTEGGVLGAISEMAGASNCGFLVHHDQLPVSPTVQAVAKVFKIDPLYCVGAGSMIMAVKESCASRLKAYLEAHMIEATVVGQFTALSEGCRMVEDGEEKPFAFDGKDPYWEAFFKALNDGWR